MRVTHYHTCVFATGSVIFLPKSSIENAIVISGGDVTIDCQIGGALVIARGKITCTNSVHEHTYLIAGKSVSLDYDSDHAVISENDSNPLGYIRWSDPPKGKTVKKK